MPGVGSPSALPVPEPILPHLPTLGIVWGEGFEHSLPLVSSVLYFQAFPLLCLHRGSTTPITPAPWGGSFWGSTTPITPAPCGEELLGLHYPDHSSPLWGGAFGAPLPHHSSPLWGGAPRGFLEGRSDTGVEGNRGRGPASCRLLIPSV